MVEDGDDEHIAEIEETAHHTCTHGLGVDAYAIILSKRLVVRAIEAKYKWVPKEIFIL